MSDDTRATGGGSLRGPAGSTAPLADTAGEVDHSVVVAECIGSLFQSASFSDLILVVEDERFAVHRVVLAARSEYFRALLFNGMAESAPDRAEIELRDLNPVAFRLLLCYLYTGKLTLLDLKEETVLDLLGLAHQYNFAQLEDAVSNYLKAVLNPTNICMVYNIASLYGLNSLCRSCLEFIDQNAQRLLESDTFYSLSRAAMEAVISRDSFCAPEIDIFRAVSRWAKYNPEEPVKGVMACVRLPLMTLPELLHHVRPAELISADAILDAIRVKTESRDSELPYRGSLLPEVNVATTKLGAVVTRGECKMVLLDGDITNYDLDRGFCRHPIEDTHGMIVVKLGQACIVNTVKLLLWDRDMRSYSYFVEVSMDEEDWVRVVDYRQFLCRSWQELHFQPRVVRYIKVVGTHNTVNRVFHAVALEAFYTHSPFRLESGLLVPDSNVATAERSACVLEGVSRMRNALINGDTRNYDWDSGYTCHQLGNGAIVVQLAQPYVVDSMRMLLWDCDDRSYSYTLEVSTDNQNWSMICDRSAEPCRSWQIMTFEPLPVTFIRIIGTHNTANEVFHVVHFECPCDAEALAAHLQSLGHDEAAQARLRHSRSLSAVRAASLRLGGAAASSSGDSPPGWEPAAAGAAGGGSGGSAAGGSGSGSAGGAAAAASAGDQIVVAAPDGVYLLPAGAQAQDLGDPPPQWATARPHSQSDISAAD